MLLVAGGKDVPDEPRRAPVFERARQFGHLACDDRQHVPRAALARLRELLPEISIAWIERNLPFTPAPMAKFLEGFRKVGLD